MKIIIEIKDTARLDRISMFGKVLDDMKDRTSELTVHGFDDVIQSIKKEW